jgi:hypothetical protein
MQATELHDGRFAVAEPHRSLMYEASRTIRRLLAAVQHGDKEYGTSG